ncbi:sodium:sulfate symporter transmembrane region domain-containing protein [Ditylenchus destructor]|uniref:Sodium:sulfate symporter transmembrane region domain-containing protein n=1 Tax=Ditylenchus destructor TaxID=166010 RepID=A0AAD4MSC5_9BILA|nr:sodium:sulfate symporter transmembrane region domain-containing protein [Ditylenchus destructor]
MDRLRPGSSNKPLIIRPNSMVEPVPTTLCINTDLDHEHNQSCSSNGQNVNIEWIQSSPASLSNSLYNVNSRQNIISNDDHTELEQEKFAENGFTHSSNSNNLAERLTNALVENFGPANKKRLVFANWRYNSQEESRAKKCRLRSSPCALFLRLAKCLWECRQALILMLTPLMLMPLVLSDRQEYKCAFCVGIMAVYWTTEVMPLAVTAMLPVVLFPLTGILSPHDVSKEFLNDTNFLFIGGLIVATAVEKCDLHQRLALRVLTLVGSQPKWIMLGFMVATAVLSMFISNTATTAMMVPIGESVINQLMHKRRASISLGDDARLGLIESDPTNRQPSVGTKQIKMAKGLMLSICFAANIGGIGTITGTPPNLVMVGMLSTLFPHVQNNGVHYLSWMAFAVPLMILCLIACWVILLVLFIDCSSVGNNSNDDSLSKSMRQKYEKLPPMDFAQKSVCTSFAILLILWIGRDPQLVPGIADLLPVKEFYTDATSAMLIAIILFILPTKVPIFKIPSKQSKKSAQETGRLMDWPTMQKKFPWGLVFLLGGGFALAAGVRESGLSNLMGDTLSELLSNSAPTWTLQLVCIGVTMLVTNICSNTVTASIFIPIVATLASEAQIHPLSLILPTTIACSFAFVLPVGSPPNAIVFSSKSRTLRVSDMVLSGFLISLATLGIVMGYIATLAPFVFPNLNGDGSDWLKVPSPEPPAILLSVEDLLLGNSTETLMV